MAWSRNSNTEAGAQVQVEALLARIVEEEA